MNGSPPIPTIAALGSIEYWSRIVVAIANGRGDEDFTLAAAVEGLSHALDELDRAELPLRLSRWPSVRARA